MDSTFRVRWFVAAVVSGFCSLTAAPAAALTFVWGDLQMAETKLVTGVQAYDGTDFFEDFDSGYWQVPGDYGIGSSVETGDRATAYASLHAGRSALGASVDLASARAYGEVAGFVAGLVDLEVTGEEGPGAGSADNRIVIDLDIEGNASALGGWALYDEQWNILAEEFELHKSDYHASFDLEPLVLPGGRYYLEAGFFGVADAETDGGMLEPVGSSFDASVGWDEGSAPPVPEPASWLLLIGGLGAAAAVRRLRRRG